VARPIRQSPRLPLAKQVHVNEIHDMQRGEVIALAEQVDVNQIHNMQRNEVIPRRSRPEWGPAFVRGLQKTEGRHTERLFPTAPD
jgi:hypothetical protein